VIKQYVERLLVNRRYNAGWRKSERPFDNRKYNAGGKKLRTSHIYEYIPRISRRKP
jgi:hypothetical protein